MLSTTTSLTNGQLRTILGTGNRYLSFPKRPDRYLNSSKFFTTRVSVVLSSGLKRLGRAARNLLLARTCVKNERDYVYNKQTSAHSIDSLL
jgi:hypothetical protein